jgi:hypothetical protein
MSAFSSGQTPSNTSLSNAHFSSQASDSSIVVASYPNLPPGQYGVTVGPGMLGVHLKQSYWPAKGGIYIDSIVPGGYAEKSRVMMIGDTILKVGDVDVSKGTVAEVPKVIGRARRPVLLVCTGDFPVDSNMVWFHFLFLLNALEKTNWNYCLNLSDGPSYNSYRYREQVTRTNSEY